MLYDEEANWARMQLNLDELLEVRGNALLRQQWYKIQMTREYYKRVVKRPIKVGDLVLRKMEVVGRAKEEGKLTPNWEGPYKVVKEVRDGTYRLETMEGRVLPRTWNADNLKKYYM